MTAPDGNLPAALDKLNAAITAIAEPVKGWHADGVKLAPSLYEQLVCDVTAKAGERAGTFHRASTPPVYIDALMLRSDIDATVKAFDPAGTSTPDRLHRIASGRWRPQDAERLELLAADLERWTVAIKSLLEPEHVKSVSAPCPACGATTAYRQNKIGERVRQAALQIVASTGCRCLVCNAHWPPEQYLLLCKVLGFDTPAGVVG
ncbi:MAG TPA: hypothetical protein PLH92_17200 [Mycobacterium sp.]|nr:hypothetical protein [Mycobacterium sp.]HQC78445.1 hypothetical protein [Mycobacterium sp.]